MRYTDYKFHVPEEKIVRLIVDTDAKNEADDQFAIVQALLSPKFENVGMVAAIMERDTQIPWNAVTGSWRLSLTRCISRRKA